MSTCKGSAALISMAGWGGIWNLHLASLLGVHINTTATTTPNIHDSGVKIHQILLSFNTPPSDFEVQSTRALWSWSPFTLPQSLAEAYVVAHPDIGCRLLK